MTDDHDDDDSHVKDPVVYIRVKHEKHEKTQHALKSDRIISLLIVATVEEELLCGHDHTHMT